MHRSPHQTGGGTAGQGIIPLAVCVSSATQRQQQQLLCPLVRGGGYSMMSSVHRQKSALHLAGAVSLCVHVSFSLVFSFSRILRREYIKKKTYFHLVFINNKEIVSQRSSSIYFLKYYNIQYILCIFKKNNFTAAILTAHFNDNSDSLGVGCLETKHAEPKSKHFPSPGRFSRLHSASLTSYEEVIRYKHCALRLFFGIQGENLSPWGWCRTRQRLSAHLESWTKTRCGWEVLAGWPRCSTMPSIIGRR